jgi:hypothetical protein
MNDNAFFQGIMALAVLFIATLDMQSSPPAKFSPVGTWEYSVPGVPEGYDVGIMVITESEVGYIVEIGPSEDYLVKAEQVEFNNKELSLVVYVEYEEVRISGDFSDDQFKGKVSYVDGVFDLTAVKVPE